MQSHDHIRKQDPGWRATSSVDGSLSDDGTLGAYMREQTRHAREQKEALWIGMGVLPALSAVVTSVGVAGLASGVFG